jgi:uncharacterized protein
MLIVPPDIAGLLSKDATEDATERLQSVVESFPELLVIGALVDADVDERDLVRIRMGQSRFGGHTLNVTMVPTLACNMRCTYCDQPEESRASVMSDEVAQASIDYIDSRMEGISLLEFTWYGGEPLLAFDRLLSMQRSLYEMCGRHGAKMFCSIVTNGLLLSRERIEQAREAGIRQIQVTIDGAAEVHDQRRQLRNGQGTYRQVLDRLLQIKDAIDVRLRINVDRRNADTLNQLHEVLRSYGLTENAYLAPVVAYTPECGRKQSDVMCGGEFGKAVIEGKDHIPDDYFADRLTPGTMPCTAPSASTFVFGPRGHVYRCWHDLDYAERAIDHVIDGTGSPSRRLFWLTYDPLSDPECADCPVLPLCLGGCPEQRRVGIHPPQCCSPLKDHLAAYALRLAEKTPASRMPAR